MPNNQVMRRRNLIAGAAMIAITIGYGVLTSQLPERSLPDTPGPPFFPWLNTVILLLLSLALLAQGLFGDTAPETNSRDSDLSAEQRWRAIWLLGAFVVYLLILPGLGFVLATIPFFATQMVLFGERRWIWVVVGSVGAALVLYILFRHGFNVFLPRGVFPDLLSGVLP